MNVNMRQALLDIAVDIGRELRTVDREPISYPRAVDMLENLEDRLLALAALADAPRPVNGYLPARHPAKVLQAIAESITPPRAKTLPNTVSGFAAGIHPALRPTSQTEEFSDGHA